ncbi:MAG: 3-oxoacyl-[acyl-carrier-protein] synthase III C-terminal domain-containing protein [Candidatus Binatia bacterium]
MFEDATFAGAEYPDILARSKRPPAQSQRGGKEITIIMRIDSIAVKIPSLEISNDRILAEIAKLNRDKPIEMVQRYQRNISYLLEKAGSKRRFIRDRERKETALTLVKSAMTHALQKSHLAKSDIDLLIYCGVAKGFLEPANAYFYADAMKMKCQCFDILDSCMGWVRALEIANALLCSDSYNHIMIINGEFTAYEYGYPDVFKINSLDQIKYTFPTYTIGEAATATVLSRSDQNWTFHYQSAPELASLCTIPLNGYEDFCQKDTLLNLNGPYRFACHASQLFPAALNTLVNLVRQKIHNLDEPDIWFPHAASSQAALETADLLGIDREKLFVKVFPEYGNLVSASIPVAMDMALEEKKLQRGDNVIFCAASAGMVLSVVEFRF